MILLPGYETQKWQQYRTDDIAEYNEDLALPASHLIRGAKALVETLGEWIERDKNSVDKTVR